MILAGDIGGTKTVLALFEEAADGLRPTRRAEFPSRGHGSLEEIVTAFFANDPAPVLHGGCFGVAGPVVDGTVRTTNLPWTLDEVTLAAAFDLPRVKLLNDLEATAFGMLYLAAGEWAVLQTGAQGQLGNVAVIAPGTGLGEAMLFWDGERYHPIASEGGHAAFAPRTERESELLSYLRPRFGGHVSCERLISGAGIHNIHGFLREQSGTAEPDWLRDRLANNDPNAVITEAGLSGEDQVCATTLEMFSAILGAEAGNLALRYVAVGGVFLGGGIPPKILPALRGPAFLEAFTAKGRFAKFVENIEVRVALNPHAALLGAAHYLARD